MPLLTICLILAFCVMVGGAVLSCCGPYTDGTIQTNYSVRGVVHVVPEHLEFVDGVYPFAVKQSVLEKLIGMYSILSELLTKAEISFWAVNETLLGVELFSGVLPWKETLELGIAFNPQSHRRLVGLRSSLYDQGLALVKLPCGYRVCCQGLFQFPYISLTLLSERNAELAVCSPLTELNDCTYSDSHLKRREIFEVSQVLPVAQKLFEGLQIPVPKNSVQCLQVRFGPNALSVIDAKGYREKKMLVNDFTANLWKW